MNKQQKSKNSVKDITLKRLVFAATTAVFLYYILQILSYFLLSLRSNIYNLGYIITMFYLLTIAIAIIICIITYKLLNKNILFSILSTIPLLTLSFSYGTLNQITGSNDLLFYLIPLTTGLLIYLLCGYLFFFIKRRLLGIGLAILFILFTIYGINQTLTQVEKILEHNTTSYKINRQKFLTHEFTAYKPTYIPAGYSLLQEYPISQYYSIHYQNANGSHIVINSSRITNNYKPPYNCSDSENSDEINPCTLISTTNNKNSIYYYFKDYEKYYYTMINDTVIQIIFPNDESYSLQQNEEIKIINSLISIPIDQMEF